MVRFISSSEKPRPRLLIVCEDKQSGAYLHAVIDVLKLGSTVDVTAPEADSDHLEPMALVETAYKELDWSSAMEGAAAYTEAWLVFNRGLHHSYEAAFQAMQRLPRASLHAAWSNPTIEYWFRLHYSRDTGALKADDEITVRNVTQTTASDNGTVTRTIVEQLWRGMKPTAMTKHLQDVCPQHRAGEIPADLLSRTRTALDNARATSQISKPFSFGTTVPLLMTRLIEIAPGTPSDKMGLFETEPPF